MPKTLRDIGLDMFSPQVIARPHAFYAQLRDEAPVIWSEQTRSWVLTRYADVRGVLRQPDRFSSKGLGDSTNIIGRSDVTLEAVAPAGTLTMLGADRPDHTRLRKLLSMDFTPAKIKRMLPRIQAITDGLLATAGSTASFDVASTLAESLPVTVIAELLGIPAERGAQFKRWSDAATAPVPPDATDQAVHERNVQIVAFRDFLTAQIEERRARPTDDFIGRLVTAHDADSALTDDEVLAGVNLLLLAGNETTTNLISNAVLALTRFPERQSELRDNPSMIDDAIEEFLRYDGSVQFSARTLTAPAEFHGQSMQVGERVLIVLASANRDPRVFSDPDVLDFHRDKQRHLGFGDWIHICLGQFLARMETRAAILGMLRTFSMFELAVPEEDIVYRPNFNLRGPSYLPVREVS